MTMTDTDLRRAADRAIDRAVRQVMGDCTRMVARWRHSRLRTLMRAELEQLTKNLDANGEGVVTFAVEMIFRGKRLPDLVVSADRRQ
jgi:hypothetical protein